MSALDVQGAVDAYLRATDDAGNARASMALSLDSDPDYEADLRRAAQATGVPLEAARNYPAEVKQQAKLAAFDAERMARDFPSTAQFLSSLDNARIAHDDVENLAGFEEVLTRRLVAFSKGLDRAGSMVGRNMQAGAHRSAAGFWGAVAAPFEVLQQGAQAVGVSDSLTSLLTSGPGWLARVAQGAANAAQALAPRPEGTVEAGIASGIQSLTQNLMILPFGVAMGSAEAATGLSAALSGGQSYIKARDAGLDPGRSLSLAVPDAAAEYVTEIYGLRSLFDMPGVRSGVGRMLKGGLDFAGKEIVGEQVATIWQDFNDWMVLHPEKTAEDYAAERPDAAIQTLIATIVGAGGQIAVMSGINAITGRAADAQRAGPFAQVVTELGNLAEASKVKARDADTAAAFYQSMLDEGNDSVWVSPAALAQSGIGARLTQALPDVQAQLDAAVTSGSDIRVSIADLMARLPAADIEALAPHVAATPGGFTATTAQAYLQSEVAQELQSEVEKVLTRQDADAAFQASQDAVRASIKSQLDTAGRFTSSVNDGYAGLVSAFYGTLASRTGTTPEVLFAQYPLSVTADGVAGLDQALAAQPPAGWEHATSGEAAVALWQGQSKARAVFWTDLQGRLAQDAPTVAGYSHSLDTSAVAHIRGQHGSPGEEALRGQLPIDGADVARIPEIVTQYDKIRSDLKTPAGGQRVAYAKRTEDGVLVYVEDVSHGRKDMRGTTLWKFGPSTDEATILDTALRTAARKAKGRARPGLLGDFAPPLSDYESDAQAPTPDASIGLSDKGFNQRNRGAFNPETLTISLTKAADLSTFLHESGHFFLEVMADVGARTDAPADVSGDMQTLMNWFGVRDLQEWHSLDLEGKRPYHEQFARGFESYLYEGKAPSIEMQGLFSKFRTWLLNVYQSLTEMNVTLTDPVRAVMDRMLATDEQIALAERGRSMLPMFEDAAQSGMDAEAFAAYQALGTTPTAEAVDALQARGLRDMRWLHNARGREIKRLQQEQRAVRAATEMEVRREVMSQPVYQAWAFLSRRMTADDKLAASPKASGAASNTPDPRVDSLVMAVAKLGGINRESAREHLGVHPDDFGFASGVFSRPLFRADGGRTADEMAMALQDWGYLRPDESLRELEEMLADSLAGNDHYSLEFDYDAAQALPGEQVRNPDAVAAGRLDREGLAALGMSAEQIAVLEARRWIAGQGTPAWHPDVLADRFGFSSGDEMLQKLMAARPPRDEIAGLTDARMLEEHGDLSDAKAIERAADAAIHNEARIRFVATEMDALAKATGAPRVLDQAARAFAAATIARLKVRDLKPARYATAAARAARAADQAFKVGDLPNAAGEKRNQLISMHATRTAYEALAEVDVTLRYLKGFDNSDALRKRLDADYAEQIESLLERFDLRKGQTLRAIDKRTSLRQWIEAQQEQGFEPDIPDELIDEAARKSYKDLTIEEFRGLADTVRQIEHLGRLKHKLLTAADQRAFEAVQDEMVAGIEAHARGRAPDNRTPSTNAGRMAAGAKGFVAAHIKAATWARVMDGGQDGGPVWEYLVRAANTRGDMETSMRAAATERLSAILDPAIKLGKMGGAGQYFPAIDRSLNREQRIAIALNVGNEGNLQRLLGGEGWTIQQIDPILKSLSAAEWQAVQRVWDHFESYRPQIAEKERRVYGREPDWVEAKPFAVVTADGQTIQMRGGYYPIRYDPRATGVAQAQQDAESAKAAMRGAFTRATTRRGHLKSRAEEVSGRPLLYSLAGVYAGVNDVIHDLAWHEWLIDANRLLNPRGKIEQTMRRHYGADAVEQFKTWTQDIAQGDRAAVTAAERALGRLRQGVSAAGLGFNVMSALIQPLGITQSIVRVGPEWVAPATMRYLAHPIDATQETNERSEFMRNRSRTRFRELNELRNQVQDQSKFNEVVGRYAYWMMLRMQQAVDVPTWHAAYAKALAGGDEEARAVQLADQAVIDSQGSGQTKDLAAIERGGPATRLFTVFYSFMNTALNIGVAQGATSAPTAAGRGKLAADMLMLYTVPAILGYAFKAAITPGGDDWDDWPKLAKHLAAAQIEHLMGLMVIAREFGEAGKIVSGAEGARDYQGPAGVRPIGDVLKLITQARQGEFDKGFRTSAINLLGDLTGLPAAQTNRTITGIEAIAEGQTDNPAAVVVGFKKPK